MHILSKKTLKKIQRIEDISHNFRALCHSMSGSSAKFEGPVHRVGDKGMEGD